MIIHPQQWPEDLDYTDKHMVVIGSGATAATIVPAVAERVAHVTQLQRSPSYYLPIDTSDESDMIKGAACARRAGGVDPRHQASQIA